MRTVVRCDKADEEGKAQMGLEKYAKHAAEFAQKNSGKAEEREG